MAPSSCRELPGRVGLIHEWFTPKSKGGAELVVENIDCLLSKLGSQADLISLVDGESRRSDSWLFGSESRLFLPTSFGVGISIFKKISLAVVFTAFAL